MASTTSFLSALVLAGFISSAAAADDPAVTACELATLPLIKSPATYKRAGSVVSDRTVILSFDAQNSFGALLRNDAVCTFRATEAGSFKLILLRIGTAPITNSALVATEAERKKAGVLFIPDETTQLGQ